MSFNGFEPCDACPVGSFASGTAATLCQNCPAGHTTTAAGSTSAAACVCNALTMDMADSCSNLRSGLLLLKRNEPLPAVPHRLLSTGQ
jgi:hypothetical protein